MIALALIDPAAFKVIAACVVIIVCAFLFAVNLPDDSDFPPPNAA